MAARAGRRRARSSQAAGLLFFAFAGYARIATLGEEVVDPARTIPRAIPIALGAHAGRSTRRSSASALAAAGSGALAASAAPLADGGRARAVRVAAPWSRDRRRGRVAGRAAVADRRRQPHDCSRWPPTATAARARRGPPAHQVPHRAELAVGAGRRASLVAVLDVGAAIGFSSFTVLAYYAVANAAALTLSRARAALAAPARGLGLAGCIAVAASLPAATVIGGVGGAGVRAGWSSRWDARAGEAADETNDDSRRGRPVPWAGARAPSPPGKRSPSAFPWRTPVYYDRHAFVMMSVALAALVGLLVVVLVLLPVAALGATAARRRPCRGRGCSDSPDATWLRAEAPTITDGRTCA